MIHDANVATPPLPKPLIMPIHKHAIALCALLVAATLGLACDDGGGATNTDSGDPPPASAARAALPAGLLLTSAPSGATGVADLRKSASDGQRVVVRGVVAGRADPIADNRAILTLLDEAIPTCDRNPADTCETPWDACCEPADVIAANAATVQVVDADGRPIKAGLRGLGNLAPLSRVVVVGTFRPSPDGRAATIDATGIYVEPA